MTNDPVVAENLLTLQRDFLRDALDLRPVARFGAEWNGIPPRNAANATSAAIVHSMSDIAFDIWAVRVHI